MPSSTLPTKLATTASAPSTSIDPRWKSLDLVMKRHQHSPDALIEVLHQAQSAFGYLEDDVLFHIARGLKLPLSRIYGVATFYHLFTLKPSGAHTCVVCLGTACHVKGSSKLVAALEAELGVHMGETTPDGQVSLMAARCLGACGIAPAIVLDGTVSGKQTSDDAVNKVRVLKSQSTCTLTQPVTPNLNQTKKP